MREHKDKMTFTHSAWFCGVVPVYIAYPDSDGKPWVTERHKLLSPAMFLFEVLYLVMCLLRNRLISPGAGVGLPFYFVSKMDTPVAVKGYDMSEGEMF